MPAASLTHFDWIVAHCHRQNADKASEEALFNQRFICKLLSTLLDSAAAVGDGA
jgi:hypothetical protein